MAKHFYLTYDQEYTRLYYPFVKGVATFQENYPTWENDRYVFMMMLSMKEPLEP